MNNHHIPDLSWLHGTFEVTVNGRTLRLDQPVISTTNKADVVFGLPATGRAASIEGADPTDGAGFIARALRHRRATENGAL